jgi:transcription termination factor Rho
MPEAKGSVLDSMTLPELKRLAEQRGISGASKMRKQALIDAIRAAPVNNPFTSTEATLELS